MLLLLWLVYFTHGISSRSISPLVTPLLKDLNMLYGQMGFVLGSWQMTYIPVALFAGILLDRWGIRKALFLGILVIGLSVLLRYFVTGFGTLLFTMALFGIGGPMISIGAPKAISVWFRGKDRGTAVGIYSTGSRIGQITALAATNGILMPLTGNSWRLTFACYGFFIICVALLWRSVARDSQPVTEINRLSINQVLFKLIRVYQVRIVLLGGILTLSIIHGFTNWLPKLLETRGLTPAMAGYGAAAPLLASIPSIILIPRLVPAHLRGKAVALLALLASASIMLVTTAFFPLLFGLMLFGIATTALTPMFMLILMDLPEVGSEHMGAAGGIYFTIAEVGGFLGPFIVGALVDITGSFLAGASILSLMGVCIFAMILTLKPPPNPT